MAVSGLHEVKSSESPKLLNSITYSTNLLSAGAPFLRLRSFLTTLGWDRRFFISFKQFATKIHPNEVVKCVIDKYY